MGKLNGKIIWVAMKVARDITPDRSHKVDVFTSTSKAGLAEALGVDVRYIEPDGIVGVIANPGGWEARVYMTELIAKARGNTSS